VPTFTTFTDLGSDGSGGSEGSGNGSDCPGSAGGGIDDEGGGGSETRLVTRRFLVASGSTTGKVHLWEAAVTHAPAHAAAGGGVAASLELLGTLPSHAMGANAVALRVEKNAETLPPNGPITASAAPPSTGLQSDLKATGKATGKATAPARARGLASTLAVLTVRVVSGGDDQALAVGAVRLGLRGGRGRLLLAHVETLRCASGSALKGVQFLGSGGGGSGGPSPAAEAPCRVVSVGYDQRLCLWRLAPLGGGDDDVYDDDGDCHGEGQALVVSHTVTDAVLTVGVSGSGGGTSGGGGGCSSSGVAWEGGVMVDVSDVAGVCVDSGSPGGKNGGGGGGGAGGGVGDVLVVGQGHQVFRQLLSRA